MIVLIVKKEVKLWVLSAKYDKKDCAASSNFMADY
ncbi:hypothetical protein MgSA37_03333 [Mucilaginibacter gotjawali]|uniref:Uncharacterized protein n=2 Tax=Mucilaginibacter gotjawali TaxID=1550579 RepID=A0A839SF65_9SPHI|nr:hypothetical protein [Mucilaginibacter gotjawali]BAU55152.1 hypothetical protein MgSA37_03333 [Mucilaginibacter gotjawali]